MNRFHKFAALAAIAGFASCGDSVSELELKPASPNIESADRYSTFARRSADDGSSRIEKNQFSGRANRAVLDLLEEAFFHGARVSTIRYMLDGRISRSGGCACHPNEWIRCRLSDGQEVNVLVKHSGRKWYFFGQRDYLLELSMEESRAILDKSGWHMEGTLVEEEVPKPKENSIVGGNISFAGIVLNSNLSHEVGVDPETLISADCYVTRFEGVSKDGKPMVYKDYHLGRATDQNLRGLEEIVLGKRASTLRHMPDGQVKSLNLERESTAWISCRMSSGQDILIHVFASDGTWIVVGEDNFRLDISKVRSGELLDSSGWDKSV